jgi:hypothetical protein
LFRIAWQRKLPDCVASEVKQKDAVCRIQYFVFHVVAADVLSTKRARVTPTVAGPDRFGQLVGKLSRSNAFYSSGV